MKNIFFILFYIPQLTWGQPTEILDPWAQARPQGDNTTEDPFSMPDEILDPWAQQEEDIIQQAISSANNRCQQSCQNTQQIIDGEIEDPCEQSNLPPNFFCPGTNRARVNPFAIFRYIKENNSSDNFPRSCLQYLLQRARLESQKAQAKLMTTARETSYLEMAQNLYAHFGDCALSSSHFSSIEDIEEAMRSSINLVNIRPHHDNYCRLVGQGCAWIGGVEQRIQGKKMCLVGGILVDSSCLNQSARKVRNLKRSLRSLNRRGRSCLQSLNARAGRGLSRLLQGSQAKTRLCCGNNCHQTLTNFPRAQRVRGGKLGNTHGVDPQRNGTITLSPRALNSPRQASPLLFHEMLHRLGMCDAPEHNMGIQDLYKIGKVGYLDTPSCREHRGYRILEIIQARDFRNSGACLASPLIDNNEAGIAVNATCAQQTILNLLQLEGESERRSLARSLLQKIPNSSFGGFVTICIKSNICGQVAHSEYDFRTQEGAHPTEMWRMFFRDRHLYDPVYACENACYGNRDQTGSRRQSSRSICQNNAHRGGNICFFSTYYQNVGRF